MVKVFRDSGSRTIHINYYYVCENEFIDGNYRSDSDLLTSDIDESYETVIDYKTRINRYKQFI